MPVSLPSSRRPTRAATIRALSLLVTVTVAALLVPASASPAAEAGPSTAAGKASAPGVWPLRPRPPVVRGFDPPGCTWCAGHRGVDLAGVVVEPVMAVLPGTVTYAGRLAGRGVVVVDHGATRTTYQPVAATVHRGDVVTGGEVIGRLESVGSHCFPEACLHLGLVRNADGVYLDPLTILPGTPQPVRLLPLWRDLPVHATAPAAPRAEGWPLL